MLDERKIQQLFINSHKIYTDCFSKEERRHVLHGGEPSESIIKCYDEIAEKVLKEDFNLKKCPNKHIWFGEWDNHRRIVVKLHEFYFHEFIFGYNYDFIPRLNNQGRFVYHRTEKSADIDVKDLFFNHIYYNPNLMTTSESYDLRLEYELIQWANIYSFDLAKKYIECVMRNNVEFMKDFYIRYITDEDVIKFLDHTIKKGNRFQKYYYMWTKAFLYAKLQDMDKAVMSMNDYYGDNKEVPQKVLDKLKSVQEMFSK